MKKYDMDLSEEEINDSLQKNLLKRNKKLNKLMDLLNNIECGKIISVDGKWGSGKTVFLKQLEFLNYSDCEKIADIEKDNLDKYRSVYTTFYYNAWENDYHNSPLLSLIYNLIDRFPQEANQVADDKIKMPFNINGAIKTLSYNFIDLDKVKSFKDIAEQIYTTEEKKQALLNLINHIVPNDKKLLFIVDELDRCKPTYAVELLEVIKHFYISDKVLFVLGTNNEQLSYTITKYYGTGFDGYGYLNKLYDLIIELDDISAKCYLENVLSINNFHLWTNASLYAVSDYLNFKFREINRLVGDFDLLDQYLSTTHNGIIDEDIILKYIFLPYCLGLKIKSKSKLNDFFAGNGFSDLKQYVNKYSSIYKIVEYEYSREISNNEKPDDIRINDLLREKYNLYFLSESDNWNTNQVKNVFFDTFSLLGNYINYR